MLNKCIVFVIFLYDFQITLIFLWYCAFSLLDGIVKLQSLMVSLLTEDLKKKLRFDAQYTAFT